MSKFSCYFLDHEIDVSPALESYADFFLSYQSSKWQKGCGDGVFSFVSDSGDKCELSVLENGKFGISVRYNIRRAGENKGGEYFSVGVQEKINQIEDAGEDQFVPIGSFLKPETAWLAVEDFFDNPTQKSGRIEWINSDDISWPED